MSEEVHHEGHTTRRWGMILLGVALLLVLLLVLGHMVWSAGAGRKLDAQAAAYKGAGEPIFPGDFVGIELGDDENGAIDLREAFKSIDQKTEAYKTFDQQTLEIPLTEQEAAAIRAAVAENPQAFAGIDAAMKRKGVNWNIVVVSPTITVLLPHLNEVRQLANLTAARAKLRFHEGDHAAALADLKRLRFLSEAVEEPPSVLVSHLVAIGINALASDAAEQMAPELKVGEGAGSASKQQVAELIRMLLDDANGRDGLRRALLGERMFQLDSAKAIADGTLSLNSITGAGGGGNALVDVAGFVAKPIALEDGLIMIRYTTAVMQTAQEAPDWPSYQQSAPPVPPELNSKIRHMVLRVLLPALDNSIRTEFRSIADRRAAALALAVRSYAADHDGKLPAKLEDLVPDYLPAVPLDPFAKGKPFQYVADATKPIVYSVGDNGADDGGSELTSRGGPRRSKWDALDFVIHLSRQPRLTPPYDEQDANIYPEESLPPPDPHPATQPARMP